MLAVAKAASPLVEGKYTVEACGSVPGVSALMVTSPRHSGLVPVHEVVHNAEYRGALDVNVKQHFILVKGKGKVSALFNDTANPQGL